MMISRSAAALCLVLGFVFPSYAGSSEDYAQCTALAHAQPAQAETLARKLLSESDDPAARHCLAIALFGRRAYRDAALELERLAQGMQDRPALRAQILVQAGGTWEAAQLTDLALARYAEAIALAQDGVKPDQALSPLLTRARLYVARRQYLKALQDLDNAVLLAPQDAKVSVQRAKVLLALGQSELASQDIAHALKLDPTNAEAKRLQETAAK
jgi:tetratricopeptide (TPR) repeat protein